MTFKYKKLLEAKKVQPGELSKRLKKQVEDFEKLNAAIPRMEQELKGGNLSVAKKEDLTTKIEEAKNALPVLDEELVAAIEKWLPNREKYAAQGQRLQAGRSAKAQGTGTATPAAQGGQSAGAASPPSDPEPAKPATSAKPAAAASSAKTTQSTPATTKKEGGMGVWGWIGLGVLTAIGAVIGVNVYRNYKS